MDLNFPVSPLWSRYTKCSVQEVGFFLNRKKLLSQSRISFLSFGETFDYVSSGLVPDLLRRIAKFNSVREISKSEKFSVDGWGASTESWWNSSCAVELSEFIRLSWP